MGRAARRHHLRVKRIVGNTECGVIFGGTTNRPTATSSAATAHTKMFPKNDNTAMLRCATAAASAPEGVL